MISTIFSSAVLYFFTVFYAIFSQWYMWLVLGSIYVAIRLTYGKTNIKPFKPSENWSDFWQVVLILAMFVALALSGYRIFVS